MRSYKCGVKCRSHESLTLLTFGWYGTTEGNAGNTGHGDSKKAKSTTLQLVSIS